MTDRYNIYLIFNKLRCVQNYLYVIWNRSTHLLILRMCKKRILREFEKEDKEVCNERHFNKTKLKKPSISLPY